MEFRIATSADIPQIQRVRHSVKENTLSDPSLVPDRDVEDYITRRGRGWVAEENGCIYGFAIVSVLDRNVWALFILPEAEKKGIGRKLHNMMMNWYFSQTEQEIWLSTAPGTRAEGFYLSAGWTPAGNYGKGERKFIMTRNDWERGRTVS
ncbi:MAG: GNAT family N-acetyltransferase [Chitinophagaceae bacterium]